MPTPTPEQEALLEAAAGAFRERDPAGRPRFHPAWWDLDEAGRHAAFARAWESRALEAALDPAGLSSTARAVLARIRRAP
jgi:hypothetical protein